MQVTKISATPRTNPGKGNNRRLRADGKIPAITYGKGTEALSLAVSPIDVIAALKSEYGRNCVVELDVEGKSIRAMIGEYQYHPVSRQLLHADFVVVDDAHPVTVKVPLRLVGKAKGIVMGGKLLQVFREIPVTCVPSAIPVEIVHDISDLDVEQSVHAGDLKMAEGVSPAIDEKRTVAMVTLDRRAKGKDGEDAEGAK